MSADGRALRLEWVDPSTLGENPANWRRHPQAQCAGFDDALDEVGWAGALLFNEATGRLIDGHMRRKRAIAAGELAVPVLIGSWPEATELKILATLDPLGTMAEIDARAFDDLLRGFNTGSAPLMDLLESTATKAGLFDTSTPAPESSDPFDGDDQVERGERISTNANTLPREGPSPGDASADPGEGPQTLSRADVPDALWPSDNAWGIPTLDLKSQADAIDAPVAKWGTIARKGRFKGTYHFYTDDEKFTPLWTDPTPIVNSGCASVVEVNFSTHAQMPRAVVLWSIYRKRWLARYWQSKGVRVFVDLNIDASHRDLALLGVPKGWKAYATRVHRDTHDEIQRQHDLAVEHAGGSILFIVVGGGADARALCQAKGWQHIPEGIKPVDPSPSPSQVQSGA
jgi:hypothetical protein